MKTQKILVPIDFNEVSKPVVDVAALIAKKSGMVITLLHIENNNSSEDAHGKLEALAIDYGSSVKFEFIVNAPNLPSAWTEVMVIEPLCE